MIRIAIGAGHGINTPGKRCMKSLDQYETREWVLNNRIIMEVQAALEKYNVEVLRVDDPTGKTDVSLAQRVADVNKFRPDMYISTHHNAGANGTSAGGIEVYVASISSQTSKDFQKLVYNKLIKYTGLKGNRVSPLGAEPFKVLKDSSCPAVLIEHGYMDSSIDVPIILSDKFVKQCAAAQVESIVEFFNLTKKNVEQAKNKLYKVQLAAYSLKENAESLVDELKLLGYNPIIVETDFIPDNQIILKSRKFSVGDAQIIQTTPDNIVIGVAGNTLHAAGINGINGTFYDTKVAPVTSPECCVFIAMNKGQAISNNAQFNGWKGPPRATVVYHTNNLLGFRKLTNTNAIYDNARWAIGGYMVKPYMDFANEQIPVSINYKTAHSYIGFDMNNKIYLIVKPNHLISDIVPLMDSLGIISAIVLDGGGSSQMKYGTYEYRSERKINTYVGLKEL